MRTLRYEPIRHGDQKQDPRAGTAEKAPTHHTRSWPFAYFGTVVAYKARRAECRNLLAQAYANTTLEQLTSVVPLHALEGIAEQMQLAGQLFTPFREMPIEERVCAAPCRPDRSGSCTGPAVAAAPRGTRETRGAVPVWRAGHRSVPHRLPAALEWADTADDGSSQPPGGEATFLCYRPTTTLTSRQPPLGQGQRHQASGIAHPLYLGCRRTDDHSPEEWATRRGSLAQVTYRHRVDKSPQA